MQHTSNAAGAGRGAPCLKQDPPFNYTWKRLARTSGMQQHTEQRSLRSSSKRNVMTLATLGRPPRTAAIRRRTPSIDTKQPQRHNALLQESLIETAPSQTTVECEPPETASSCAMCSRASVAIMQMCVSCSWGLFFPAGLVQFSEHHAWSRHALNSLCFETGMLALAALLLNTLLWAQATHILRTPVPDMHSPICIMALCRVVGQL